MVENASQHDDSLSSVSEFFSTSEIAFYSKRKKGYDLKIDLRYNLWLLLQSGTPLPTEVSKFLYHSAASKIIKLLQYRLKF